jgi:hypothetical protein
MPFNKKEIAWSLSKARMFEECRRRFYLHYYLAKLGNLTDPPPDAHLALEMKNIKGLDMWVGEVVHATIQWALELVKLGMTPSEQDVKAEARRRLSEGWAASLRQLWRIERGDDHPNLFEHYYKVPVDDSTPKRLKEKAYLSLTNFLSSEVFGRISNTPPDRWLPIEKYASFRMPSIGVGDGDAILFYLKFDFAMRTESGISVFDWKTGKPSMEESRQLACYAMYAADRWEFPTGKINVCAVHLQPELEAVERPVDETDIEEAVVHAQATFNSMKSCLHDPVHDIALKDDFPMTGNFMRCSRCNFKAICIKEDPARDASAAYFTEEE